VGGPKLKVVLGGLKERAEELQTFLEPRVGVKPSVKSGELEMEDSAVRKGVKPRQVKTYVKRFLHQKGLRKTFRVLVSGSQLTIQELEVEEEEEEKVEKKVAPEKKEEAIVEKEEVEAVKGEEMKVGKEALAPPEKEAPKEKKKVAPEEKKKEKPKEKKAPEAKKKPAKKKS
jgi:hypothetical protein